MHAPHVLTEHLGVTSLTVLTTEVATVLPTPVIASTETLTVVATVTSCSHVCSTKATSIVSVPGTIASVTPTVKPPVPVEPTQDSSCTVATEPTWGPHPPIPTEVPTCVGGATEPTRVVPPPVPTEESSCAAGPTEPTWGPAPSTEEPGFPPAPTKVTTEAGATKNTGLPIAPPKQTTHIDTTISIAQSEGVPTTLSTFIVLGTSKVGTHASSAPQVTTPLHSGLPTGRVGVNTPTSQHTGAIVTGAQAPQPTSVVTPVTSGNQTPLPYNAAPPKTVPDLAIVAVALLVVYFHAAL